MPTVNCEHCKKRFHAKPSQIAAGQGRYCSTRCAGMAKRQNLEDMHCAHCGAVFSPDRKRRKYCSTSCSAMATHAKKRGGEIKGMIWQETKKKDFSMPRFELFEDPWKSGQIPPDEYGRGIFREPDFVLGF